MSSRIPDTHAEARPAALGQRPHKRPIASGWKRTWRVVRNAAPNSLRSG